MGYLGAVGPAYDPTRATVPQLDAERFSGNNSAVAFTLSRQVVSPTDVDVIVENVRQEPIVAYSIVNGSTLTFTEAPQTGTNNIYVIYRGSGMSNYAFVPDGSISYAKLANNIRQFNVDNFTANGTGQTFTLSETPATANTVIAAIDGVVQTAPSNYNISGNTIIFTSAPAASANVTVRHLGFRTTATVTALSASSVTATELASGSVTNAKLAGSITSDKISTVNGSSLLANTIPVNTVSGNVIVANTVSNSAFTTGSFESYMRANNLDFGLRNRIINGDMRIDQRNVGASKTISDTGDITYTVDRWAAYGNQASKFTVQQDSSANTVAGFTSSLKVTSLSGYSVLAGDTFSMRQNIEGFNFADFNWGTANAKTITLSFWVRSSLTGTFGGSLRNSGNNYSYPFSYTILAANTWEQKIITVAGPTAGTWIGATNGIGTHLIFSLGTGTTGSGTAGSWSGTNYESVTGGTSIVGTNGATWYITGVQLEEGSQATPFEYRHHTTELQLCQRYFQKSYRPEVVPGTALPNDYDGQGAQFSGPTIINANIFGGAVSFPVSMRTSATIKTYDCAGTIDKLSSLSNGGAITNGVNANLANAGTSLVNFRLYNVANYGFVVAWTASAEL